MNVGIVDGSENHEDVTVALHNPANHESPHVKKRSVANPEVVQKAVRDVMPPHLDVNVAKNVRRNRKNVAERRNKVVVDLKNRRENKNVCLKKSQVNVITMLKNELEQRTHPNENHQMMHQRKIWTLQTPHENRLSRTNNFYFTKFFYLGAIEFFCSVTRSLSCI